MTAAVIGLNAFLPWGPVIIAALGAVPGGIYTQWSATRRRIKDAVFDTGPNGLSTYYDWLRDALFGFLRWAVYFLVAEIIGIEARGWINLHHAFADQITLVVFWALVVVAIYTGFCAGRAAINGRLWLALEARGMRYDVRDGHRYRVRFTHQSGANTLDDTPWEGRIQAEQEGLSLNDSQRHEYLKALLVQLLRVGIWYGAITYVGGWAAHTSMEGFFGGLFNLLGAWVVFFPFAIIVPAIVAAQHMPVPFASLLVVIMDRVAYAYGAQFATLVHVKDRADERIDLSDVVGQRATGNAGFATKSGRRKSMGT